MIEGVYIFVASEKKLVLRKKVSLQHGKMISLPWSWRTKPKNYYAIEINETLTESIQGSAVRVGTQAGFDDRFGSEILAAKIKCDRFGTTCSEKNNGVLLTILDSYQKFYLKLTSQKENWFQNRKNLFKIIKTSE